MGILDDAIREHLELKRQHGAESDDLERLEKEAFGPATRPGDPEFADPEAEGADAAEAIAAEPDSPERSDAGGGTSDWLVDEGETTVVPQAPSASEPLPPSPAEQARVEHPQLDDTADHPAPAEQDAEPAPPEAPESGIFDADDVDFGDLDLEEEDDGTVAPQAGEDAPPATEPEPLGADADFDVSLDEPVDEAPAAPPPSEPLPPTERPSVPPEDDTDNPPLPVQPTERGGEERDAPSEKDDDGEDLLGATPDFLQDAPEGEDLWFEQGPPKDFDFDDDD